MSDLPPSRISSIGRGLWLWFVGAVKEPISVFAGVAAFATVMLWLVADEQLREINQQTGLAYQLEFSRRLDDSFRQLALAHSQGSRTEYIYEYEIINLMEEACRNLPSLSEPAHGRINNYLNNFMTFERNTPLWVRIYNDHGLNSELYSCLVRRRAGLAS